MIAKVVLFCAAFAAAQASLLSPIGLGAPILEAGSLGYGKGLIVGVPSVATVSSQKTAINHVAPTAGVAVATAPVVLANNGIHASYGHGAGYGLGYGAALNAVSNQKSLINHVAPVAPRVAVAAAPVVASHGILDNGLVGGYGIASNGVVAGNGILANGLVAGHGIRSAPLAISTGLLGAPYGLGAGYGLGYGAAVNAASTQKSVINHIAPVAPRVALAAAPVAVANHGILANGLVAGAPLGIVGHGIAAGPVSIGSGLHGIPVGLSLGKAHY
ncbi:uncharacterized protein TNCT_431781 [Trichonephila clavata]|uniref:Uncharacterized protein n=1 Tax=Trichonephila clavata TaxID=2740835 RepID=A0A8X6G363_TRICU|nr:uncharacterized protein TNCT_431781 [Trichonephila clavata]